MEETIRISGVVKESIVDGPGIRYVVFTQGCPHKCEGCHNPQTHNFDGGKIVNISKLVEDIKKNPLIKGVTISGGEPFAQANKVANLISSLDKDNYNVMVYTGYTYENLINRSTDENGFFELLNLTDTLIDGRFEITLKDSFIPFRGSSNQRAIDVKKSLESNEVVLYNF